jgi:hypothetical protein
VAPLNARSAVWDRSHADELTARRTGSRKKKDVAAQNSEGGTPKGRKQYTNASSTEERILQ